MRAGLAIALIGLGVLTGTASAQASFEQDLKTETQRFTAMMAACKADDHAACTRRFTDSCAERRQWTTVAMVLCQGAVHDYWDARLNVVYKQVMGRAEGLFKSAVRDAQRKWLSFKAARCGTYQYFEGTMWRPVAAGCAADMTRERVGDLIEIRDHGPIKPPEQARPADIMWDTTRTAVIDFNCDGTPDRAFFGLAGKGAAREAVIGWIDGGVVGQAPQFVFAVPVGGMTQYALCGTDVTLETLPAEAGACPVLRVDDGRCDALFVSRDKGLGTWRLERN